MQKYDNQTQHISGYAVTLKYGSFSKKGKMGCCIFEITKEDGSPMKEPKYVSSNHWFHVFGDEGNEVEITMSASGSIENRGILKNGKLMVYTTFASSETSEAILKTFYKYPIMLYNDDDCLDAKYGFSLDDNIGGKTYQVDGNTKITVSYLGVTVDSDKKLTEFTVEAEKKNGEKESIFKINGGTDVKGYYGEGYGDDIKETGKETFVYNNVFLDVYNLDEIKDIYLNGKKL